MMSVVPLREQPSASGFSESYIDTCHIILLRQALIYRHLTVQLHRLSFARRLEGLSE